MTVPPMGPDIFGLTDNSPLLGVAVRGMLLGLGDGALSITAEPDMTGCKDGWKDARIFWRRCISADARPAGVWLSTRSG